MCSSGLISLYMAHLPRRSGKFFPSDDPSLSLLASFGVFSIGYLMRPLGGLLFGTLGDRLGRRSMLVSSVLLMVLASLAIGLLPGYSRLGVASAWLLTLLRMLQGLSVGGEFAGSITYVVESAPQEKRGRHASFAAAGAVVGFVFGSLVAALVEACLPPTAVNAWGWRLPFLFGSALGGLTLWLRSDLEDTRPEASSQDRPRQGLLRQLRNDGPLILRVVGALAFTTVSYNLVFLYWVQRAIEMHPSRGGVFNAITCLVEGLGVIAILWAGRCADRLGPLLMMRRWNLLLLACLVPAMLLQARATALSMAVGQLLACLPLMLISGTYPVLIPSLFGSQSRCTGFAFSYSLVVALLGGSAPALAAWMMLHTHGTSAPLIYCLFWAIPTFWALSELRRFTPAMSAK